jgi:hypothetical protein
MTENAAASWPKNIAGIRAQLANYDPMRDRGSISKIEQDIVATYGMSCFAVTSYFGVSFEDYIKQSPLRPDETTDADSRERRLSRVERTQRIPSNDTREKVSISDFS